MCLQACSWSYLSPKANGVVVQRVDQFLRAGTQTDGDFWKIILKYTTWYLKAYRFRLSSVYFGRYHFLTIIFILVNTSRCNLHANKIFCHSHSSFPLFSDFCSQKSVKMMLNFGSLIFSDKFAIFFVQFSGLHGPYLPLLAPLLASGVLTPSTRGNPVLTWSRPKKIAISEN